MKNEIVFWKYKGGGMYKVTNYKGIPNQDLGVCLGDNAVSSLLMPPPMKETLTNASRAENGVRFMPNNYLNSKDVSLELVITGKSRSDYYNNLSSLMDILNVGHVAITIPLVVGRVFFLEYQSCQTFALSRSGCVSKITIKLKEFNPQITAFSFKSAVEKSAFEVSNGIISEDVETTDKQ